MTHADEGDESLDLLIGRVDEYSTLFTAAVDEVLGTEIVENGQFTALVSLADREPHAVADLAPIARMDRRRLLGFLRSLEDHGLLELGTDEADHRRRVARLTLRGARRLREADARLAAFFSESAALAREIAELSTVSTSSPAPAPAPSRAPASALELAALVAETGLDLHDVTRAILGERGFEHIRGHRLLALNAIRLHGACRPSALVDDLRLSPGGVTYLLDGLENDGLIRRERDVSGDRRGVTVTLTDAGLVVAGASREAFVRTRHRLHQRFSTIGRASVAA
ncbi:MarR family transcriptional regulator [Demequina sp. SYSU T00192]|uniref:MarR family transcriptional regulator n=1 Tax=Demequina litoralis TaxID=3051660 RepID=A0ABT8GBJ3_9MICO|nr:MarR family transcriptional regulator [Demequina sp. SYSU T00192]MDN4476347.1 MarR family transcriptional regulator [Demequina sp. SYSU T00192]